MSNTNEYIRRYAKQKRVYLWELARKFEVTDSYFSRCLREEFTTDKRERAIRYIDEIAANR